ncbi:MAG: hypothetical protein AAF799_35520 [Myxococcota bacterium]
MSSDDEIERLAAAIAALRSERDGSSELDPSALQACTDGFQASRSPSPMRLAHTAAKGSAVFEVRSLAELELVAPELPRDAHVYFSLQCQSLEEQEVAALGRAPQLQHVRTLDMSLAEFGDDATRALVTSPHLSGLEGLHLWKSGVTEATVEALAEAPCAAGLRLLNLCGNFVQDGAAAVIASAKLESLTMVDLSSTYLTAKGAATIIASMRDSALRQVSFRQSLVRAEERQALLAIDRPKDASIEL